MKKLDYEKYTELKNYTENLRTVQKHIRDYRKLQFGSKCLIGDKPDKFYTALSHMIDEECKSVFIAQEEI